MRTDRAIGIIGTGIFLCLTLQGISFLISYFLREVLLFSNLSPIYTYGLSEYASLIFVLIIFIYTIKKIKKLDFDQPQLIKRIFLISIIAYVLTQVIGFAQPFNSTFYDTSLYFDLKMTYTTSLRDNYTLKNFVIDIPVWILKYLIIGVLILKEIKLFKTKP